MGRRLEFTVHGKAEPAGSKTAGVAKDGRRFVRDSNPASRAWKQQVAQAAGDAMTFADYDGLLQGPLKASFEFYRTRPRGHFGTGSRSDDIRPSAPPYPTTKPDALKLARAVEDGMTGVVYRDDAQIVLETIAKAYADRAMVRIIVEEVRL